MDDYENKEIEETGSPELDEESDDGLKQLQTVAMAAPSSFHVPDGEHRLQTPWTLYWLNKAHLAPNSSQQSYLQSLRKLGTFNSVESFWRHYVHLKRPSGLDHGFNVALFRANLVPAWESFPTGGCWIIKIAKKEKFLNQLWEELLMSTIGENFLTPELVGVLMCIRRDVCNITVWNRDNTKNDVRFRIGERLKEILNLDEESTVEYKFFAEAVKDKSTHRNATAYTYTVVETPIN
eukprot:CAMPEP_0197024858 /NCGR_PEP_ID=MMETSP1384-20130603/5335_1 /TAXON_ID=29189 /ORGANISM="Ammonia sp." /LENGTH=235 /DNA_ID=CAMNT_0042453315 /DNA_START=104 /DNA_END=811 /DNA_ORIENTATION=-